MVYDTGRPEFVIRTRGVDPYDDSLYCRPQTAFAAWRVFAVIPFRYTSFWGPRGSPRAHGVDMRVGEILQLGGDLRGAIPLLYFRPHTTQKTAVACAIAVYFHIKPAVPCEQEDRNPALARWCPLFCFVLPTSALSVKGAIAQEVCIPAKEVPGSNQYLWVHEPAHHQHRRLTNMFICRSRYRRIRRRSSPLPSQTHRRRRWKRGHPHPLRSPGEAPHTRR